MILLLANDKADAWLREARAVGDEDDVFIIGTGDADSPAGAVVVVVDNDRESDKDLGDSGLVAVVAVVVGAGLGGVNGPVEEPAEGTMP